MSESLLRIGWEWAQYKLSPKESFSWFGDNDKMYLDRAMNLEFSKGFFQTKSLSDRITRNLGIEIASDIGSIAGLYATVTHATSGNYLQAIACGTFTTVASIASTKAMLGRLHVKREIDRLENSAPNPPSA